MTPRKAAHKPGKPRGTARRKDQAAAPRFPRTGLRPRGGKQLVIVTGISGAGKASALKAFEDLGFHCVDNLPLELLPDFAGLVSTSTDVERAAIVVDVREGATLDRLPEILKSVKKLLHTRVVFLDAQDAVLVRRLFRDAAPAPARPLGDGVALHCGGAAIARPHPQRRRHAHRHLQLQRARAARRHPGPFRPGRRDQAPAGFLPELRFQEWRSARRRHGLRCALPAQSAFCGRVPQEDRARSQGGRLRARFPADHGSFSIA